MSETESLEEKREAFLKGISELPDAVREWLATLGCQEKDVIGIDLFRPLYLIGTEAAGTRHFKPSGYVIATIEKMPSEKTIDVSKSTEIAIFATKDGTLQLV